VTSQFALTVHFLPVTYVENRYRAGALIDLVHNAIGADADTPTISPCELSASAGPWVFRKAKNGLANALARLAREILQLLLSTMEDEQ